MRNTNKIQTEKIRVNRTDVETSALFYIHSHTHTVQQTAEPVTECDCEMIIRKSGWWMDCELVMSRPSSLILCDGFFVKDTNTDKKVTS